MPIPYERLFLTGIGVADDRLPSRDVYPFTIPAIAGLRDLAFKQPVTFLVGENGTGKSTLLEAIAVAWGLNPEGGSMNFHFPRATPIPAWAMRCASAAAGTVRATDFSCGPRVSTTLQRRSMRWTTSHRSRRGSSLRTVVRRCTNYRTVNRSSPCS